MAGAVALATAVIGTTAILVTSRLQRGQLLSPIVITMAVLVSIFGIRPLFELDRGVHVFYGHDVSDGVRGAAFAGFIAITWCLGGYAIGSRLRTRRTGIDPPVDERDGRLDLRRTAIVAGVMIAAWLLVMIQVGGGVGFLRILFQGRSATTRSAVEGLPVLVSTLPTSAAILLAAQRIRIERIRSLRHDERLLFWAMVGASLVPPMALGTRRFLLPAVIAAAVAAVLPAARRRVSVKAVAAGCLLFLLLVSIPFIRSTGSRTERTDTIGALSDYITQNGVSSAVERYFLSYDTEMFSYVSYLDVHLGDGLPYGRGKWLVVDPMLAPLPAAVVRQADVTARSDDVLTDMLGQGCTQRGCPVPSLAGIGYSEFGILGVAVLLALWGLLCAQAQKMLAVARGLRLLTVLTFIGFVPALVRGNSVNQLWIVANVIVIVYLGDRWCNARAGLRRRPVNDRAAAWVPVGGAANVRARRQVFISVVAQHENLGDLVIRREAVRWALRSGARPEIHLGNMPPSYVDALDLPSQVRCTRSILVWESRLVLAALRRRAAFVMAPGMQFLSHSPHALVHQVAGIGHAALLRATGCPYLKPGRSYRGRVRLPVMLERIEHRLAIRSWVRDATSNEVLGTQLPLVPDIALARHAHSWSTTSETGTRDLLCISPRRAESWPDELITALIDQAAAEGLRLTIVTQVRLDEPLHRDLAERFDLDHVDWGDRDHATQLQRVLRSYARAEYVVSDRLHALLFAVTEGARLRRPPSTTDTKLAPAIAAAGLTAPLVFDRLDGLEDFDELDDLDDLDDLDERRHLAQALERARRALDHEEEVTRHLLQMNEPDDDPAATTSRTVGPRVPWMIVSQLVSAVTNAAVIAIAAHRFGGSDLGQIGLAVTAAVITVTAIRCLASQPLLVRSGVASVPIAQGAALGVATTAGVVVAALIALTALWWADPGTAVVLALGTVPLVVQDHLRYACLAEQRPWIAAVSDVAWLVTTGLVVVAWSPGDVRTLLLQWIIGACVGAFVAAVALQVSRWRREGPAMGTWFRETRPMGMRLLGDMLLVTVYGNATPFVVAAISGLGDAGSYRVGLTVVGVVMVVITGAAAQSLADMSRIVARGGDVTAARLRSTRRLVGIAGASVAVLLVLPGSVGRLVFSDAWADARSVAIVLAASAVATAIVTPALSSIRAHGAADEVLRLRMRLSPVQLALVAGGGVGGGATGAAVGLLVGNALSIVPWLRLARRCERHAGRAGPSADGSDEQDRPITAGRSPSPSAHVVAAGPRETSLTPTAERPGGSP